MLQQYVEYKEIYTDCILLFQVGDFYELFFEDAVIVARTLNLTLTSRDKNNPNPIPMCGVPISVVDAYAARLVAAKYSVAIVSQNAPTTVNGKQVITRSLERIVTPGIKILGQVDRDHTENVIASVYLQSGSDVQYKDFAVTELSVAFSNIQTGRVLIRENLTGANLIAELSRIQPIEIIIPTAISKQKIDKRLSWVAEIERKLPFSTIKSRVPPQDADSGNGRELSAIKGYASLSGAAKKAVQLLLRYVDETTVSARINISEIAEEVYGGLMSIDATSKRNLELVQNLKDYSSEATLFDFLNFTVTLGGERLLRHSVLNPLIELPLIQQRQELLAECVSAFTLRGEIQKELKYISDLERIAARSELLAILPKEVMALRDSLNAASEIKKRLDSAIAGKQFKSKLFREISANLQVPADLIELLMNAIMDNPEVTLNQGGIIRDAYNAELDTLREIKNKGSSWIAELEASERVRTGINSLKIKYNNVIGYFIEITAANSAKAPDDFIRKQTTANTERFTTHELRAREKDLLGAESKLIELERKLFEELRQTLKTFVSEIRKIADALSKLDMFLAFAECSEKYDLIKPEVNESCELQIEDGKHPVLLKILKDSFVPTTLKIRREGKNFLIITGPNMGGKSTYLRQAALISVLAQIGANVPAKSATVGIVDKIFARLGASDNQREGESTFMVEMREASHIIANATAKSLLLIDEIGRGTATADGLSIAQAILEWVVEKINCRTLFATHFHELTGLEETLDSIANYSVGSYEKDGDVIFTHNIIEGPASSSYGLEVAKLAGLPAGLLSRAKNILLSHAYNAAATKPQTNQLSFFEALKPDDKVEDEELLKLEGLKKKLLELDLNSITPLESLNLLSKLVSECS